MLNDAQMVEAGQDKLAYLKANMRPVSEFFDRSKFNKPATITEAGHRVTRNSRYFGELTSPRFLCPVTRATHAFFRSIDRGKTLTLLLTTPPH